ncbi:MBL fold metallo-hydrolase [Natronorubrum sulfidifaciens]|uniref:Beta-lactamase domain protein n=1 Tax=Natronorubrum sulfidifaciens JCM 14089 TaxID=1230460 RepID=L9W558_9EURY|nr:MBL fold metallo-hydrolase [Natronorubrum sulfidifaciens]ELY44477.1 beta-lactamase domain protein [Natronorubrum sulfidifaciens JCM 14089]
MTTDTDSACRGGTPFSTVHRLEFDVPWPPKHVAAYVIDGPEPILIDAGAPGEEAKRTLETGLERVGYAPEEIDHVLVTHPHSDHIGQIPPLRAGGATIHAPAVALERLEREPAAVRSSVREAAVSAGYRGAALDEAVDDHMASFHRDRELLDPDSTVSIDPGSTVSVGSREFTTIPTPGHETSQLCFETTLEETTVLFTGDVLIEPFRAVAFDVGLETGAYDGLERYAEAMDRLEGTTATHGIPGHGPVFEEPRRVVERTRERLETLISETRDALAAIEPATPLSVAEQRVGSVRHIASVIDTMAALGTLERRDVVAVDCVDGVRQYRTV